MHYSSVNIVSDATRINDQILTQSQINVTRNQCTTIANIPATLYSVISLLMQPKQSKLVIFYYPLKSQHISISNLKIFKILTKCFGRKKPSSAQNRTKSKYNEGVHSMGPHIVYSYWYFKNHLLADTKLEKV